MSDTMDRIDSLIAQSENTTLFLEVLKIEQELLDNGIAPNMPTEDLPVLLLDMRLSLKAKEAQYRNHCRANGLPSKL